VRGSPAPEEYAGVGDVTEFRYGDAVSAAFRHGNLASLDGLAQRMRLPSQDAVAFIDNHDTQRNGRSVLTYSSGATYRLAQAFLLAYPYGVPQVMSGYAFSSADQGPPAAADGTTNQVSCGTGWVCEHRNREVANMVAWRASAADRPLSNWWSNGSNQIAFGRGGAAFIAFNRSGAASTRTFAGERRRRPACRCPAVTLPAGRTAQYKYVKKDGGTVIWARGQDTWR